MIFLLQTLTVPLHLDIKMAYLGTSIMKMIFII